MDQMWDFLRIQSDVTNPTMDDPTLGDDHK